MSLRYEIFGECAILISWPNEICKKTSLDIYLFNQKIQQSFQKSIRETATTYCSLTVYTTSQEDRPALIKKLKNLYTENKFEYDTIPTTWKIPVCYHESFGIDLKNLAQQKQFSVQEIINYHSEVLYTVDFLGFLPGFPYLSGLNPLLHKPRLSSPRLSVAKGSIAIGGKQTGIYPIESPGGWHILGRTPLSFFDVSKVQPCFIKPLDQIKFYPISLNEFCEYDELNELKND